MLPFNEHFKISGLKSSNSSVRNLSKSIEDAASLPLIPDKYYNCKQEYGVEKEEIRDHYEDYILPTVTKPVVIKQEPQQHQLQLHHNNNQQQQQQQVLQHDNLLNLPIMMNSNPQSTTPTAASLSSNKLSSDSNPNTLNSCNLDQPPSQNSVRNAFLSNNEYNLSPAIPDECKLIRSLYNYICVACGFIIDSLYYCLHIQEAEDTRCFLFRSVVIVVVVFITYYKSDRGFPCGNSGCDLPYILINCITV